uniref:Rho guanine nucleotide exchange factor 33 n=1 Tax=Ovis aries TaxID=9940 RepID=A0AC11EKY2_SHEEP
MPPDSVQRKKEKASKHLSAIKTPGKTRKGAFAAPSASSLKRKMGTQLVKISVVLGAGGDIRAFPFPDFRSSGSEYREKTNENPSMDPSPTKQDFFRNRLALANELDQGTAV